MFPHLTNEQGRHLDEVQLTGMLLSCVIGIFSNERNRKQPVTIDLCLYLNTRLAAETTHIHDTIDYAAAVKEVTFILEQCEFLLIETAVETVCKHFLTTYTADHRLPAVEAVVVRISKPSALTHGIVPSVQILRRKSDYISLIAEASASASTRLHDGPDGTLTLVRVPSHTAIDSTGLLAKATSALTMGRWTWQGTPVKSRSTIIFQGLSAAHGHLEHEGNFPQLLLVRSTSTSPSP